jgi:hypothetical protein
MPAKIKILSIHMEYGSDTVMVKVEVDGHLEYEFIPLKAGHTLTFNLMEEDKIRIFNGEFTEVDMKKFGWKIELAW